MSGTHLDNWLATVSLPVVALPRYEGLVTGDAVKSFMKVVEKEVMALMMDGMGEAHDEM